MSSPKVLACVTDACYRRIGGGGERGVAVMNQAVMLSPRGIDPVIASHEMSHVELHARGGKVPQWFDEGLAVVVSDDRRYLAAPDPADPSGLTAKGARDRCLVRTAEPLPDRLDGWLRAASADRQVYAKAACRTNQWLVANGGRDGLLRSLGR